MWKEGKGIFTVYHADPGDLDKILAQQDEYWAIYKVGWLGEKNRERRTTFTQERGRSEFERCVRSIGIEIRSRK